MAVLSKTRTVLSVDDVGEQTARFASDEGRGYFLEMPIQIYDDLGSPEEITVSIEPGNVLEAEA